MSNSYYNHSTYPTPNSPGSSAQLRAELELVTDGFDKLPTLAGNGYKVAMVNAAGDALIASAALQSLAITASTLNSTPIGGTNPSTGAFTTLSASGGYTGNVTGNVTGNLTGNVTGNVVGNITSTGASSFTNATITGGTINGVVIGASSAQAITGTLITATTGFVGGLTGNVTGNVTGNLTGNVTGNVVGNVTGNLTGNVAGNVTAASGTSTFNNVTINGTLDMDAGSSATIINLPLPTNSGDAANKAYVDQQDALRLALAGGTMSGAIAMGNNKITGLGTPTADADAATKAYVDGVAQGLDVKASVRAATTANITLSGTQTVDGVALSAGDRVLVKDQSTASQNGIYVVAAGSWSRSSDADSWAELVAAFVFVEDGSTNDNNGYVCTVAPGGTLGSTAVTWEQFSGAGQINAGAGLSKTGNTIQVNTASSSRIVVGADEIDLATTGVTASTYKSVTVDQWGRVTGGTNPTTLSGYGITDAYTNTQVDTLLAAKLNLSGGTMTGALAMGTYRITGMGDPVNAQDAATKNYIDVLYGSTASAAASAAAAATSASNAATSASNASTSASAASGSASAAASSAAAAAASYDDFDDRYLGPKSSPPTVDNDGNPLVVGALYFDTTANLMKVYTTSSTWANAGSSVNGTSNRATYTATAGQTTFAITYDVGYVDVYLNGVKQVLGTDFVATNGTSVVFASGLTAGDIVDIVAYGAFNIANVLPLSGGTMTGNIVFAAGQTFAAAAVTGLATVATTGAYADLSGTPSLATVATTGAYADLSGKPTLPSGAIVGTTDTQTLTNKTVEAGVFTNGYTEETVTANTGTAYTISLANGSVQILTLTGNCTFTFPAATAGQSFILLLKQDGTGSRTVTWPAAVKWPGGTAPTITSTASKLDKYIFTSDGTNWYGSNAGQNYTV